MPSEKIIDFGKLLDNHLIFRCLVLFRLHLGQQPQLGRLPQVAGIDGHQDVGRGVFALGSQPRHQRAFLVGDETYLDAGFLAVGVEQRLDQLLVTGGVHGDFFGSGHGGGQCSQDCESQAGEFHHERTGWL